MKTTNMVLIILKRAKENVLKSQDFAIFLSFFMILMISNTCALSKNIPNI